MVQTGPRRLEPRELPLPEIGAGEALLRVEACGICGSDHEQFEGVLPRAVPVIPGHEPLGAIEAIGDRAAQRWGVDVGDRVAVETMLSCRFCRACLAGRYQLCRARRIYSYIPLSSRPGCGAPTRSTCSSTRNAIVHRIDAALPPSIAVLFNPLGAGFRWAVEIPHTGPATRSLILGPGQRGLASVLACREAGAGRIIVTGLAADAHKLALARGLRRRPHDRRRERGRREARARADRRPRRRRRDRGDRPYATAAGRRGARLRRARAGRSCWPASRA